MSSAKPPSKKAAPKTVEEYLASVPEAAVAPLQALRATIRKAAPQAEEVISMGVPTYRYLGPLVSFSATPNHCAFYVMSPGPIAARKAELKAYDTAPSARRTASSCSGDCDRAGTDLGKREQEDAVTDRRTVEAHTCGRLKRSQDYTMSPARSRLHHCVCACLCATAWARPVAARIGGSWPPRPIVASCAAGDCVISPGLADPPVAPKMTGAGRWPTTGTGSHS